MHVTKLFHHYFFGNRGVRVLYPRYRGSSVMAQNLDTTGSLQRHMAEEPSIPY
jgi:hypothetical protein